LLGRVLEVRPQIASNVEGEIPMLTVSHEIAVVLTADCDLEQDFSCRSAKQASYGHPQLVAAVLLCDVFTEAEIHPKMPGSDVWKRVRKNQDERYHAFSEAPVEGIEPEVVLPGYFLDFKRVFTVPPEALYASLSDGNVIRVAKLSDPHLYDLLHRFFGFQSRIGVA